MDPHRFSGLRLVAVDGECVTRPIVVGSHQSPSARQTRSTPGLRPIPVARLALAPREPDEPEGEESWVVIFIRDERIGRKTMRVFVAVPIPIPCRDRMVRRLIAQRWAMFSSWSPLCDIPKKELKGQPQTFEFDDWQPEDDQNPLAALGRVLRESRNMGDTDRARELARLKSGGYVYRPYEKMHLHGVKRLM